MVSKVFLIAFLIILVISIGSATYIISHPEIGILKSNKPEIIREFNLKLYDSETKSPIEGEYEVIDKNLKGFVKKDFISKIAMNQSQNYTLFITSDNYYPKEITFYDWQNNLMEVYMDKIGKLVINQTGTLSDSQISLTLSSKNGTINGISYCYFLTDNLINLHNLNDYDSCWTTWLNFKINDTYHIGNITYYPEGIYRCPYSMNSINEEDTLNDKITLCSSINGNICYRKSMPIPEKYKNKAIYCSETIVDLTNYSSLNLDFEILE